VSSLHRINACSPLGFCVDYDNPVDDFDGNFEWSARAGEVTLDPTSDLINKVEIKNILLRSNQIPKEGIVHQINDNNGDLFELGRIPSTNRWVVRELLDNQRTNLFDVQGYAFLSSRHTGVITIGLKNMPESIQLLAFNSYHKAAFLSWAFLIRKAICNHLDIEINEFDIGFRIAPESSEAEIYIVEKADNGAGYCNYLNGNENIAESEEVFIQSLLPGGPVYSEILMPKSHQESCGASCYDCLRDYYNQQYHSLLNWRVALDLAALANDSTTPLDFSQEHWYGYLNDTLLATLENKLEGRAEINNGLYLIRNQEKSFLIVHPFWSDLYKKNLLNAIPGHVDELNIMDAIAKVRF
jgi:DEAD/DEAH box helicase domain-containing protein